METSKKCGRNYIFTLSIAACIALVAPILEKQISKEDDTVNNSSYEENMHILSGSVPSTLNENYWGLVDAYKRCNINDFKALYVYRSILLGFNKIQNDVFKDEIMKMKSALDKRQCIVEEESLESYSKDTNSEENPEEPNQEKDLEEPNQDKDPEDPNQDEGTKDPIQEKDPEEPNQDEGTKDPIQEKDPEEPNQDEGTKDPIQEEDPGKTKPGDGGVKTPSKPKLEDPIKPVKEGYGRLRVNWNFR